MNSTKPYYSLLLAGSVGHRDVKKNIPTKGVGCPDPPWISWNFWFETKTIRLMIQELIFFSQGSKKFLPFGTFEDDFPFPKVEYVSFDIYLMVKLRLARLFPQADAFLGVC